MSIADGSASCMLMRKKDYSSRRVEAIWTRLLKAASEMKHRFHRACEMSVSAAEEAVFQEEPGRALNHLTRLVGRPRRGRSKMVARPSEFGEQTDEVLVEFGFGKEEIAELRPHKVVWANAKEHRLRTGKSPGKPGLFQFHSCLPISTWRRPDPP